MSFFLASAEEKVFSTIEARKERLRTNPRSMSQHRDAVVNIKVVEAFNGITKKMETKDLTIWDESGRMAGYPANMAAEVGSWKYRHQDGGHGPMGLIELQVSLEGSAGSLRRATGKFECKTMKQFNWLEENLLRPSTVIEIQFHHSPKWDPADESDSMIFTIYDFSFTITDKQMIQASFKAVGKGQECLEANIFNSSYFPSDAEFIADYNGTNEKKKVSSLPNLLDWLVQKETGKLDSYAFSVPENTGWDISGRQTYYRGHRKTCMDFCVMHAPSDYDPPGKQKTGRARSDRITYYSLNFLCWVINRYVINKGDAAIVCDGHVTKSHWALLYKCPTANPTNNNAFFPIYSADPISVMIVRDQQGMGQYYNNYSDGTDRTDRDNLRFDKLDKNSDIAIDSSSGGAYTKWQKDNGGSDLSRILISRDLINALGDRYTLNESDSKKSKVSVEQFLGDIFATIKDLTGGAVDLYLHSPNDPKIAEYEIWVINGNEPADEPPKVVYFDPLAEDTIGDGKTTISMKVTGKVPKGLQAEAFGGTPSSGKDHKPLKLIKDEDLVPEPAESGPLWDRLKNAFINLAYEDFKSAAVNGAKGVLKELVDGESLEETANHSNIPYPLEMELIITGTYGFKFGDTISSKYLPEIYQKESGLRIAFTITKINNRIMGGKWVTELTSVCRMVNN